MTKQEKKNIYNAIQNLYNMDFTTWQEVLAMLYNLVADVEQKFEKLETRFTLLLGKEVTEALKKMYNDGSLGELINDTLLQDINNKVDNFKNEVNNNVDIFKNKINEQLDANAKLSINYDGFGEQQNKNEETYTYPNRIDFGNLEKAPSVKNIPHKGIDLIAHWYNDFGLEYTASGVNQANGSYKWYDWRWNHTNTESYDAKRHPLLGWYKGDDVNVLDWICYWLAESGINVVCLTQTSGFSNTNWNNPSDLHYWEYQLLNNVKNFKSLKYILSLKADSNKDTLETLESQNDKVVEVYSQFPNVHTYIENSKRYACVFAWDTELLRGALDNYNGYTNINAYYIRLAKKMKNIGYDGVCILGRNTNINNNFDYLRKNDVILFCADYSGMYGDRNSYYDYEDYVNTVPFVTTQTDKTILNVLTSADSHKEHSSTWSVKGSTPELFKKLLNKALDFIEKNNMPKMLTIYNVSEWAEGGASLQPNVHDGFGYLDAVKSIRPINNKNVVNIEVIKKDSKNLVFENSQDWIVCKLTGITANGGSNGTKTIKDITPLVGLFDYTANLSNIVYFATLVYKNTEISDISCYINPSWSSKRCYVVITNNSGADITDLEIDIMIRKINI